MLPLSVAFYFRIHLFTLDNETESITFSENDNKGGALFLLYKKLEAWGSITCC